ncbi:MAG: tetratricopeptide repeat protein [Planctomycetes bacterium]|nr:tetratricopeptide repeat protein [Planctomycetota bacterium]
MLGTRHAPVLFALTIAGCAGVSPRPGAQDPESLPVRVLSTAEQERLTVLVEQLVQDAVLRRFAPAESGAVAALAIDPRCARARAVRGIVLLQVAREVEPADLFLANEGEAEVVMAELLAPEDPFVGWMRAQFLADSGHLSAASAAAEAALSRSVGASAAERAPLFGLAGSCRYELGEERAALPLLQAYAEVRSDDSTAIFRIGSCLLRMSMLPTGPDDTRDSIALGHAERAARAFSRCVELAPGDEDAALAGGAATMRAAELASACGREDRSREHLASALEQFEAVADRFPANAEALFRIGVVEEQRGRSTAAIAAYEAALARDEAHLGSLLNLAALLDAELDPESADHARAVEYMRRALRIGTASGGLSTAERRQLEARTRRS